jgi:hypothetical protein
LQLKSVECLVRSPVYTDTFYAQLTGADDSKHKPTILILTIITVEFLHSIGHPMLDISAIYQCRFSAEHAMSHNATRFKVMACILNPVLCLCKIKLPYQYNFQQGQIFSDNAKPGLKLVSGHSTHTF